VIKVNISFVALRLELRSQSLIRQISDHLM
jgi:hypothetical protein